MKKHLFQGLALAAACTASLAGSAGAVTASVSPEARTGWRNLLPHHKPGTATLTEVRQGTPSSLDRTLAATRFQGMTEIAPSGSRTLKGLASGNADLTLDPSSAYGYLDGPDGSTWFYTGGATVEEVKNEYYTDKVITGYEFTIYDSKFNRVGTISDKVRLQGDELRAASVGIDAAVTQKFFNTNANYEVMVVQFFNHADYSVTCRTGVYTLDGQKDDDGNSQAIATYDGMPIDAINMAMDKWSEDFFITFRNENFPNPDDYSDYTDYLNACAYDLTTYKKGGWSGDPVKVLEYTIPQTRLPGDGMSSPYFMSAKVDGKPTFTIWHYALPFFDNPIAENPAATPDNTLDIHTFSMPAVTASEATLQGTTSIATTPHTGDRILCTFYGLGLVGYTDDVLRAGEFGGTPQAPAYIITTEDYSIADDDSYTYGFYAYGNDGSLQKTIAENAYGFVSLTTPSGAHRQTAIINNDEFGYSFRIMDLCDGEEVTSFEQVLDREVLTAALDRVRTNGRDFYVSAVGQAEMDENGDVFTKVVWIGTDGHIDHVDRIPLGQNVAMSNLNIDGSLLTPYIFDTDDEVEYMAIVKRRIGTGTQTQEELLITAPSGIMLTLTPDDTMGALSSLAVVNKDTNPQLMAVYNNGSFTQTFFSLPLTRFAGGDGTAASPYQIASVADLQQIKGNPSAFYALVKDFDATGFQFEPVENFSGVLDGAGHTIENLTLDKATTYLGIFSNTGLTAEVKDLTFINPVMHLSEATDQAGLIAASAPGMKVSGVHVYGLTAYDEEGSRADATFGSIIGDAKSTAAVSQCFVAGARIDLPESSPVGGIIGRGRTGVSVKASAFTGSINADTNAGGIAGSLDTGDETIADCHVDADITAKNTVGGIAGSAARSILTRNYVEGTVTATTPGRWDKVIAAGGVVGSISTEYNKDNRDAERVSHNVVAVSAINAPAIEGEPEYPAQFTTVHRIAGRTGLNEAPDIIDYDEDYNPIYDTSIERYEGGLQHNYVVDILAPVDAEAALHNGTEGESIDRYEIGYDFLTLHGFRYGTDGENPWSNNTDYDPALHFESGIIINPSDIQATEGSNFNVDVHINTRAQIEESELFDDFMCDYDTDHIEMTGEYTFNGKTLSIAFTCLKAGVSQLTVKMLGSTAKATVTGVSGIDNAAVSAPAENPLAFDGRIVTAEGCAISLYAVSGAKAAQGFGSVDASQLPAGVYVAVATAADGARSQLKLAVR